MVLAEAKVEETQQKLALLKSDPVLFAKTFLKDKKNKPWTAYWYQEKILRSDKRFLLICTSRQIGKSESAAAMAIHRAVCWPNQVVLLISRSQEQANYMLKKVRRMIEDSLLESTLKGRPVKVVPEPKVGDAMKALEKVGIKGRTFTDQRGRKWFFDKLGRQFEEKVVGPGTGLFTIFHDGRRSVRLFNPDCSNRHYL